ncbi:hypothetical protein SM124_13170 [Bacillus sp. 31A1R]|uniref:Uncharacterized protein n=1 Tax=Robertmurraya mangrovi TaxID=3098077 RepID=A0ABU5IZU7_9BACI|nr:hypothetical protein [Bacillus sp. 31A1R]MDZ5472683.1 hypothetical protein [Bacillus sp. 31A1R]
MNIRISLVISILFVLLVAYLTHLEEPEKELIISEAKLVIPFDTLEEMHSMSPLIVVAKKTSFKPVIQLDGLGHPIFDYTVSTLKIITVIKDETGKHLSPETDIRILETVASTRTKTYSTAGYMPMKVDHPYLLFLDYNLSEEGPLVGAYNIQGISVGKFPIEPDTGAITQLTPRESKHLTPYILHLHQDFAKSITKYDNLK